MGGQVSHVALHKDLARVKADYLVRLCRAGAGAGATALNFGIKWQV
jgi:hypothetical protein